MKQILSTIWVSLIIQAFFCYALANDLTKESSLASTYYLGSEGGSKKISVFGDNSYFIEGLNETDAYKNKEQQNNFSEMIGQDRGGGDICENEIKIIKNDIIKWIKGGGYKQLILPENISHQQYHDNMLEALSKARVRCVSEGDSLYPIEVFGVPKICAFSLKEISITCDRKSFLNLESTNQYVLLHHDYAGLAKIEVPNKGSSVYTISNQISSSLEDVIVKRLAIKEISSEKIKNRGFIYIDVDYVRDEVYGASDWVIANKCVNVIDGQNLKAKHCSKKGSDIQVTRNQTFALDPGFYLLRSRYSTLNDLVEIKSGEQLVLELAALSLSGLEELFPGITKKYSHSRNTFRIYDDFSDLGKRNDFEIKSKKWFVNKPTRIYGHFVSPSSLLDAYYAKNINLNLRSKPKDKSKNVYFFADPTAQNIFEVMAVDSQNKFWLHRYNKFGRLLKKFEMSLFFQDENNIKIDHSEFYSAERAEETFENISAVLIEGKYSDFDVPTISSTPYEKPRYVNSGKPKEKKYFLFPGSYILEASPASCYKECEKIDSYKFEIE